jgi:hypothetical protein
MFEALVAVCIIGYIAFRNWLNHDKRRMVHRERIAAIEKGIQLPAIEQEVQRRTWNVQRFLLLAGWSWIFIGIAGFIVLSFMVSGPWPALAEEGIPSTGLQFISIIPIGIGVAHLISYWAGERHERRSR